MKGERVSAARLVCRLPGDADRLPIARDHVRGNLSIRSPPIITDLSRVSRLQALSRRDLIDIYVCVYIYIFIYIYIYASSAISSRDNANDSRFSDAHLKNGY